MKSVSIECTPRENVGKSAVKSLRKQKMVPCILYGGKDNIAFAANVKAFKKIVYTPEVFVINLNIDGNEHQAVMKDIQFHPVTDEILHVDFMKVEEGKPMVLNIPVKLSRVAPGVKQGGKLHTKIRSLQVKAKPADLPDFIEVDINRLNLGKSIKVGDLKVKGLEILNAKNTVIASVKITRVVVIEEPVAAPATPETEEAAAEAPTAE
jgi:large subunit ribosomal protein L25